MAYFAFYGPSDPIPSVAPSSLDPEIAEAPTPQSDPPTPPVIGNVQAAAAENPTSGSSNNVDPWADRIGNALTSGEIPMRDRSKLLLEIAGDRNAPTSQRLDALSHGLNLLDDENYWTDALPLGLKTDLPVELGETIFTELHDRDIKLYTAVCEEIMKVEDHPLRQDAQDAVDFLGTSEEIATSSNPDPN